MSSIDAARHSLSISRLVALSSFCSSSIRSFSCSCVGSMSFIRILLYVATPIGVLMPRNDHCTSVLSMSEQMRSPMVGLSSSAIEFIPEFVSKLNFYISAVDEYVKAPEDKPTIGLLLCRTKSETKAKIALRGITQPLGIAQYDTEKLFADVASALPQIEDLEDNIENETFSKQ